MRTAWLALVVFVMGFMLAGCAVKEEKTTVVQPPVSSKQSGPQQPATQPGGANEMVITVTSSAFQNNAAIPKKFTADGEGVSPELTWTAPPRDTKEIVLIMYDPDAPGGPYYHWTVYGLAPTVMSFSENLPKTASLTTPAASQGMNSANTAGYTPPAPPPRKIHHYHFVIYALKEPTKLAPKATPTAVQTAVKDKILTQGEIIGTYSR